MVWAHSHSVVGFVGQAYPGGQQQTAVAGIGRGSGMEMAPLKVRCLPLDLEFGPPGVGLCLAEPGAGLCMGTRFANVQGGYT